MLEFHPITDLFPPMTKEEYEDLREDIRKQGVINPVETYKGKVIDGKHRTIACAELEMGDPPTVEWNGEGSLTLHVLGLNMHRRHLSASQRGACAADAMDFFKAEAKKRQARTQFGRPKPSPDQPPETVAGKARDEAGRAFNVGPRTIQRAIEVRNKSQELHDKVKAGEITVNQASRAIRRGERRALVERAAETFDPAADRPWRLLIGDVAVLSRQVRDGSARLVFADPPYNQGIDYGNGKDADLMLPAEYEAFCRGWMADAHRLATADGSFWVVISEDYADYYGVWLREAGFHRRRWIVWDEAFGVNAENNFSRDCRHIFYCVKDKKNFIFNFDAFKVDSLRHSFYGDRRAHEEGKIMSNLWHVPRLNDACHERIAGLPTQLPVALLAPIVAGMTLPGDLVVDLFAGSGSLGEACITGDHGRRFVGIEVNAQTAKLASGRLIRAEKSAAKDLASGKAEG